MTAAAPAARTGAAGCSCDDAPMQCTLCGGGMEFTGGGAFGRCLQCGNLFTVSGGQLTPMVVVAPGESSEEAHARVFSAARPGAAAPEPARSNPTAVIIK